MQGEISPLSRSLAAALTSNVRAHASFTSSEAAVRNGKAAFWWLGGFGLLLVGLGTGTGAALYGWSLVHAERFVGESPVIVHNLPAGEALRPPSTQAQTLNLYNTEPGAALADRSPLPAARVADPIVMIIRDPATGAAGAALPPAGMQVLPNLPFFGLGAVTGLPVNGLPVNGLPVNGLPVNGSYSIPAPMISQTPPVIHDQAAGDALRPTPEQLQNDSLPASKIKIVTNFTIFKTADFAGGEVQTGWRYEDSNQQRPSSQYCLFVLRSSDDMSTTYTIGTDGKMSLPSKGPAGIDLKAAYANCDWAAGEAPAAK